MPSGAAFWGSGSQGSFFLCVGAAAAAANCAVCWEELPAGEGIWLECCHGAHGYCGGCLRSSLMSCLADSQMPACKMCAPAVRLTPADVDTAILVAATLPEGPSRSVEDLRRTYETVSTLTALAAAGAQRVECLTQGCGTVITLDPDQDLPQGYRCQVGGFSGGSWFFR